MTGADDSWRSETVPRLPAPVSLPDMPEIVEVLEPLMCTQQLHPVS